MIRKGDGYSSLPPGSSLSPPLVTAFAEHPLRRRFFRNALATVAKKEKSKEKYGISLDENWPTIMVVKPNDFFTSDGPVPNVKAGEFTFGQGNRGGRGLWNRTNFGRFLRPARRSILSPDGRVGSPWRGTTFEIEGSFSVRQAAPGNVCRLNRWIREGVYDATDRVEKPHRVASVAQKDFCLRAEETHNFSWQEKLLWQTIG